MAKVYVTWALLNPTDSHKAALAVQKRSGSSLTSTEAENVVKKSFPGCTSYETREYTGQQILNHFDKMVSTGKVPLIRVSDGTLQDVDVSIWTDAIEVKYPGLGWSFR